MRTLFPVKLIELNENGDLQRIEFYDSPLTPSDVAQFISYCERGLKFYRQYDRDSEKIPKTENDNTENV